ncbi:MAG: diacylglycerol kinase [Treponema sp.]|jgi:diacylglycerol kinase family enzyme|nr:diacylglycerol kinase [Treponema sp.]
MGGRQKRGEKLAFFAEALEGICSRCLVLPGTPLRCAIIANPGAGGFTIPFRWRRHEAALKQALADAGKNRERPEVRAAASFPGALAVTAGAGSAAAFTRTLLAEAARDAGSVFLVITAGGDGTALEVMETLFPERAFHSRFVVLRLPMGTGNDGADALKLEDALRLLTGPTKTETARAVRLVAASGKNRGRPFLAFNILSVGLDAFVTHMTNRMKGKFPGDSYKLWVDIASLLYDRIYRVAPMELAAWDKNGNETMRLREKLLLCAVGAGGHRTYGAQKRILPDDRNVCTIKQMPLLRKIAFRELFDAGTHVDKPEAVLFNAERVTLGGIHPVLAQMDGEAVLLTPEDFPVTIELTEPAIQILRGLTAAR